MNIIMRVLAAKSRNQIVRSVPSAAKRMLQTLLRRQGTTGDLLGDRIRIRKPSNRNLEASAPVVASVAKLLPNPCKRVIFQVTMSDVVGLASIAVATKAPFLLVFQRVGGADGIRTHGLLDAIEARSQLRHGPTESNY